MVKMTLLLIVLMQSNCLYGMELSACHVCDATKINVKQELFNLKAVDGKVAFICSGINEQQLIEKKFGNEFCVGDTHIYHRRSMVIEVVEPILYKCQYTGEYSYYVERRCLKDKDVTSGVKWYGDDAIRKASDDLALCYKNVLAVGLKEKLCDKQERSIAFSELGICFDFSREKAALAAVPAILKFIKDNPKAYSRIDLFVKKQSEFDLYKMLFDFYLIDIITQDSIFFGK